MAAQTAGDQPKTRAEIEAEIEAARDRLAENIADLIDQVHPKAIVRNTVSGARDFVAGEYRQLKEQLVDENGLRMERVGLVLAAAAGAVTFALVVRSIFSQR